MNLSNFYARTFGFYLIIMSVGLFFKPQQLQNLISMSNSAVMMALGIFGLIFGLAVVVSHQKYHGWPLLITLIGYWATLKGILIIFFPELSLQILNYFLHANTIAIGLGIDFALGVILLFCGYRLAQS